MGAPINPAAPIPAAPTDDQPNMVMVTRGGLTTYVSEAEMQLGGPKDPTAVDWTEGTPSNFSIQNGSAPAPMRQTLHTMVLPPTLRMHLQVALRGGEGGRGAPQGKQSHPSPLTPARPRR